jgi:hypothetical protein
LDKREDSARRVLASVNNLSRVNRPEVFSVRPLPGSVNLNSRVRIDETASG